MEKVTTYRKWSVDELGKKINSEREYRERASGTGIPKGEERAWERYF
jgi:hypothetical protein